MLMMDKLLSGRRVLVVEDEILILMMIEDMLADLGCESVTSAGTINRAVALIDGQVFDAAILDINLNGHDSHPVADALAARGVLFVFCTGNGRYYRPDGYFDRAVLRKPFRYDELVETLTRLLSR
jgi:CheY-like chemotaxis protein